MIHIYYGNTGNSLRAILAMEENNLDYSRHYIDLEKQEQKKPDFLKINPMGLVPVMIDENGLGNQNLTLTQSASILYYACQKSGLFQPKNQMEALQIHELMNVIVTDAHPVNGVLKYIGNETNDYALRMKEKFIGSQKNALLFIQNHLANREYIIGNFSVLDIALYPLVHLRKGWIEKETELKPILEWYYRMSERATVKRAYQGI